MNIAFLIGRIIFGGYWLMASFNHFKNLNYMSEYAKAKGTPFPKLAVAGTGVILLLGGLSTLLGVYPVVGIILLIIFLLAGTSIRLRLASETSQEMWSAASRLPSILGIVDVTRRFQCAVKGAGPQREERPARELDRSAR
jgi:uncharacterized membrane protein YphA (DoxX/SURF4 family)